MVSEGGNSPMLRELVQMLVRVNDRERSDWISEGLAEYYAIELLRRAGGMSDERYQSLNDRFARDSKRVTTLRGEQIRPATVAKAVLLLQELDREIRLKTRNKDRKSVVKGKRVSVRVDIGGRRRMKKKKKRN